MSELEEGGAKELAALARKHGVPEAEVLQELDRLGLPPRLLDELLRLATVEFRSLSRWGQKAEYRREVRRVVGDAARRGVRR